MPASSPATPSPTTLSTSVEEKQNYSGEFDVSRGAYQTALADLEKAKINLQRTEVASTVDGCVTNLQLRVADYANTAGMTATVIVTPRPSEKQSVWGDIGGKFAKIVGRR